MGSHKRELNFQLKNTCEMSYETNPGSPFQHASSCCSWRLYNAKYSHVLKNYAMQFS